MLNSPPVPDQVRGVRHATRFRMCFGIVAFALGFICVVLPNSLRPASFVVFACAAILSLYGVTQITLNLRLVSWLLASVVTLFYVAVGWSKMRTEAVWQVPFVYALSPGLWLLICSRLVRDYPVSLIVRFILLFGLFGGLSVFAFYFLFLTAGADAVRWMIKLPNVEYGGGTAAATMYVFGSLMFVCGGFFAAPQLIRRTPYKLPFAIVLVAAVLLSGRAALALSIVFGLMVFGISMFRRSGAQLSASQLLGLLALFCITAVVVAVAAERLGIDVGRVLDNLFSKVASGGGEERSSQFEALIKGIGDTWLLGAGHGIGVPLIRSEEFPWRYELLLLATVYRVGIVGAAIYAVPVVIIFSRYLSVLRSRNSTAADDFMFGGFLSAFLGAATNPYYESFEFQWMLILPFVYFTLYGAKRGSPETPVSMPGHGRLQDHGGRHPVLRAGVIR